MLTLANLLTLLRLLLILPGAYVISHQLWFWAAGIFVVAVLSDIGDGIAARRLKQSSKFGALFDHTTDAVFVSANLTAFVFAGTIPYCLPILIVLAFAQYVLDSKALAGQALRMSILGRYNGIAYFVLLGIAIAHYLPGFQWIPSQLVYALGWILIISTVLSIMDRAWALIRLRRKANQ
jgi:cardiolipin synthase